MAIRKILANQRPTNVGIIISSQRPPKHNNENLCIHISGSESNIEANKIMKQPRVYPVFHGPDDNVITDKGCEFLTTSVNSVGRSIRNHESGNDFEADFYPGMNSNRTSKPTADATAVASMHIPTPKLQWLGMDNIQASIHSINAILLLKPKQTGGSDTANVINNTFIDIGKRPQL
ncbi:hypothetical protein GQX74_013469 [Glossina fuscipes]|nr:hypothetical protein GQX74_013469 [Glossina fuscipes]